MCLVNVTSFGFHYLIFHFMNVHNHTVLRKKIMKIKDTQDVNLPQNSLFVVSEITNCINMAYRIPFK
jgi:hypothetical protein